MAKNKRKRRTVLAQRQGKDLVLLAGLPKDTLKWILETLSRDTSKRHCKFTGTPSTKSDWKDLYRESTLTEIQRTIAASVTNSPLGAVPTPRRILVLYVPSKDFDLLITRFGITCYLKPLLSVSAEQATTEPVFSDDIAWRHDRRAALEIITQALEQATVATDALKLEITDKGRSPLSLPAWNFYFPDKESPIYETYLGLVRREASIADLSAALTPKRFSRDQLPARALKGNHHADRFFQDVRDRVFPPDMYHAPNRYAETTSGGNAGELERDGQSGILQALQQRYRFGVIVRDGNVHYDVQYEMPRKLSNEPMYCAAMGNVLVTGSHANVGVNDVIWAPDGRKESVTLS